MVLVDMGQVLLNRWHKICSDSQDFYSQLTVISGETDGKDRR
jgi:hypothetical protein